MGGINILPNVGAAIAGQVAVKVITGSALETFQSLTGPWRPPQWGKPAVYMITVTGNENTVTTGQSNVVGTQNGTVVLSAAPATATTMLVFDAVLRARHSQGLQITEHPIQTGANISDHAYLLPFRLTLEIGMSDAMAQYKTGMWVGASSKSVSAYQTLLKLQAARVFLTLTTRLQTYQNMLIEEITPEEDSKTIAGLRATISFKQVFTATVATQDESARPNTTDNTQLATVQPQPTPPAITQQYAVNPPADPTVSGSGFWTSVAHAIGSVNQGFVPP